MKRFVLLLIILATFLVTATACGGDDPVHLLAPEATPGDFGVAVLERDFRVRVDDRVRTQIYLPTTDTETLADGPFPVVLFLEGGAVTTDQYAWIATHIASQGYLVVMPEHFANLAIFSIGNGADVVEALDRASQRDGDPLFGRVDPTPAVVMGHSLGGVIAIKTWLDRRERFSQLVLLQSRPDTADTDRLAEATFEPGEVFAIGGSEDLRITPELIAEELARFSAPVPLAIIDGQNHFQLVDGSTPGQAARDGAATIDDATGRARLLALLDLILQSHREPGTVDITDPDTWPEGVIPFEAYQEGR